MSEQPFSLQMTTKRIRKGSMSHPIRDPNNAVINTKLMHKRFGQTPNRRGSKGVGVDDLGSDPLLPDSVSLTENGI